MRRKLKDCRGETLVELMASIVIASLSVTLVFGAIMASASLDRQALEADEKYYETLSRAERQGADDEFSASTGTVTVTNGIGAMSAEPDVTFYGGEGAVSYALNTPSGTGGGGP